LAGVVCFLLALACFMGRNHDRHTFAQFCARTTSTAQS
jgi:hypothetical protein